MISSDSSSLPGLTLTWTGDRGTAPLDGRSKDFAIEAGDVRRIKGCERPCILFPTWTQAPDSDQLAQWVYTSLTRSTSLLVIALTSNVGPEMRSLIGRLDPSHLLFWTEDAESAFKVWAREVGGPSDPLGTNE